MCGSDDGILGAEETLLMHEFDYRAEGCLGG